MSFTNQLAQYRNGHTADHMQDHSTEVIVNHMHYHSTEMAIPLTICMTTLQK